NGAGGERQRHGGDGMTTSLSDVEQQALDVARATYEAVRHSEVMDAPDHWDRFANRLRSAAYAPSAPAFLEQISKRFSVAHTDGEGIVRFLGTDPARQREVLRTIRAEANALSVLVRAARKEARK